MTEIIKAEHATQAGHFYDRKTGEPRYTVIGKNGKERNSTIADCKKNDWVPSVMVIIACQDRPALNQWKMEQMLLAAMTTTRQEGESEADHISFIKESAKEQGIKAAQRGTEIHAFIQKGFQGEKLNAEEYKYFISAKNALEDACNADVKWRVEESFATEDYGGKVDLQSDEFVCDIKTTDKDLSTIKTWDDHAQQLAAYRIGSAKTAIETTRGSGILYIHKITAEAKLIWIPDDELDRGYSMFLALLLYYKAKNRMV